MDALAPASPLIVRRLGRRDYEPVWQAMQRFTDEREATTADELWLLEHPPVFTLGQAGRMEHVLAPGDIPVVQVDRGGQVTYHGPGQVVLYPLLDLRRIGLGIRGLVELLEQAVIEVLEDYGVSSQRRDGAPGVYAGDAKVAALGLRVRRGCTYHGLAFNVAMDLEPFGRINPCGFRDLAVTQVRDLCDIDDMGRVGEDLLDQLARLLDRPLRAGSADLPQTGVRSIMEQQ